MSAYEPPSAPPPSPPLLVFPLKAGTVVVGLDVVDRNRLPVPPSLARRILDASALLKLPILSSSSDSSSSLSSRDCVWGDVFPGELRESMAGAKVCCGEWLLKEGGWSPSLTVMDGGINIVAVADVRVVVELLSSPVLLGVDTAVCDESKGGDVLL